jgi:hypothetical protein
MSEQQHKIPDEKDWMWVGVTCPFYREDTDYSRNRFMGKSLDAVTGIFIDLPLGASEDLYYMPPIPFRYYMMVFKKIFMEKDERQRLLASGNASDAASTFLLLVENRLKEFPHDIMPIMADLMPVVEYVASHQELFDADPSIYGSFQ